MASESIVTHRGRSNVSRRVWDAWEEAELLAGFTVPVTQGSYQAGQGASASAGTHDGGGAVDGRARHLSVQQRADFVLNLRRVGFAAWLRNPGQANWPYHFHAILKDDRDLSPAARMQVRAFELGRNGLQSNLRDPATTPFVTMTWNKYLAIKSRHGARTLRKGMRGGNDIIYMQAIVGAVTDAYFGPVTVAAVKRFQSRHGLVVDGVVGPQTWRQILK